MKGDTFSARVYRVAAQIPKGKVATYGQLARLVGRPGAARAVGSAMRTNKDRNAVPCHRVVGANGALTGYAYGDGTRTKRNMLLREGVKFRGNKVDLTASLWKG